jgi:hypothetical protein
MFPPKSFFFPEYHRSISRPFRLTVFAWHRPVGGDDLPVQDHVRRPLLHGAFQRLFEAGRLCGHDRRALGYVAVRRRLRQAEPGSQPGDVRFIPVPGQDEQRLPVTARFSLAEKTSLRPGLVPHVVSKPAREDG